jgi:hypothetical protein
VQRICRKRVTGGFLCGMFQRMRSVVVDHNRCNHHYKQPPADFDFVIACCKTGNGFIGNPKCHHEQQSGFNQGCNTFDLGMTKVVVIVSWLIANTHGKQSQGRGTTIEQAVKGFR